MSIHAVDGFLPSRNGFRFANRWPSGPAREWHLGLVHLGIGDVGRLAMVGLVRRSGFAVSAPDFGHQVVAYRYESSPERVSIGIYDPNHPGDDRVELVLERAADGSISLGQSTGEPLLGLLALPGPARS